ISIKNILILMIGIILFAVGLFAIAVSGYLLVISIMTIFDTAQKMTTVPSIDDFLFALLYVLFGISIFLAIFNIFILSVLSLLSNRFVKCIKKIGYKNTLIFFAWSILSPFFLVLLMLATCHWGQKCTFVP